ncbi:caspase family protein [Saccharothrix syringae]|uniref:Caspase family protein n=1 Tax=Saccharothrix syringae TaxID=103733 RepID=A0A5Q0H1N7_SACSY|nr:caspase family protein [Saccharothrix syringae]QFZ19582.1 caspase family protein [Saccharothrix syringae]
MRRALLVGIDRYDHTSDLGGCENDAHALQPLLSRNEDNSRNLDCRSLIGRVTRDELLAAVQQLLAPGADFALLYFAGHGRPVSGDVALATTDGQGNTPGVRFGEILEFVKNSPVSEVVVILDCCFSGGAGTVSLLADKAAVLRNGVSILTASRSDQTSDELNGRGIFSTYLEGALDGGAADVLGHVTVAGLYAYLSESFGAWDQRPTFKTNVDRLHPLRSCKPDVPVTTLQQLTTWFPTPDHEFPLDPTYEPDKSQSGLPPHPEHEEVFRQLQLCRASKLLEPVGHEHMYYAAMQNLGCRLTPLGKHYWHMVDKGYL